MLIHNTYPTDVEEQGLYLGPVFGHLLPLPTYASDYEYANSALIHVDQSANYSATGKPISFEIIEILNPCMAGIFIPLFRHIIKEKRKQFKDQKKNFFV